MSSQTFSFNVPLLALLLMSVMGASVYAALPAGGQSKPSASSSGSTQQPAPDVKGTWSGTFYSKHSNVAPFTMTVVINPDTHGHLVGSSSLNSDCLKGAHLAVTVTGSQIVFAGSDEEGDSITVRGTVDKTGTMIKTTYLLNGSATGRCETDDGTGDLAKR